MGITLWTIGHSNHALDGFLALLRGATIACIIDVRSAPFSRRMPHFNRERLRSSLAGAGVGYIHLGRELGGRPADPALLTGGMADYERMAASDAFKRGLEQSIALASESRHALTCAERDPLDCHRCLLVARAAVERGVGVRHILGDGAVIDHLAIEERLLDLAGTAASDLFAPRAERLAAAYRARARKVAFAGEATRQARRVARSASDAEEQAFIDSIAVRDVT